MSRTYIYSLGVNLCIVSGMFPVLIHHLIQTVSSPSSHVSRLHLTDLRGSSMLFCVGREGEGTEFSLAGPELLLLSCDDDRLLVKKHGCFQVIQTPGEVYRTISSVL